MARPRTPTTVLEQKGAYVKDPARGRARENEPQPTGPIGDPPASFTLEQRQVWSELIAIAPPGVLKNADRHLVEMYCRILAKLRVATTPRAGDDGQDLPPADVKVGELNFVMNCLSRMGMTPADRSKVSVPKPNDEPDFFAELADEQRHTN